MTETYTIEVTRQPVDADDTTGLGVKGFRGDAAPVAGERDDDVEGYLWMLFPVVAAGGFFLGYGGGSFYHDYVETHSAPRNPRGGGDNR